MDIDHDCTELLCLSAFLVRCFHQVAIVDLQIHCVLAPSGIVSLPEVHDFLGVCMDLLVLVLSGLLYRTKCVVGRVSTYLVKNPFHTMLNDFLSGSFIL